MLSKIVASSIKNTLENKFYQYYFVDPSHWKLPFRLGKVFTKTPKEVYSNKYWRLSFVGNNGNDNQNSCIKNKDFFLS